MLKGLYERIRQAGAKREANTKRDGFLSYKSETHSLGVGAGLAWLAIVTGDIQLLGVVIPAITSGLKAKDKKFGTILTDVMKEPHYALGGVVLGGVLALPFGSLPF